jgi:hypothetical protein
MIEKKINPGDHNEDHIHPKNEGISFNLKDDGTVPVPEEKKETEIPKVELPSEPDLKIASFLHDVLEGKNFERFRKENPLMIPFTDENTSMVDWLANCIKMLLKPDEAKTMSNEIDQWFEKQNTRLVQAEKENEKLVLQVSEKEKLRKDLENEFLISDTERKQLRRELLTSISAVILIDLYIPKGSSDSAMKISGLLKEEMINPSGDYQLFVMNFLEGWKNLSLLLEKTEDTEAGMEDLHLALTGLLEKIAGKSISQRRPILNILAGLCSNPFKIYKFISPEESLQVDPRIHAATALGGSTIREGISFAVIRKDTMQTVKYAEIKV